MISARLGLLSINWLGLAGISLIFPMFFVHLSRLTPGQPPTPSILDWFTHPLSPLILLIPAYFLERRIDKFERENPVPPKPIVDGKVSLASYVTNILVAPILWIKVSILLKRNMRLAQLPWTVSNAFNRNSRDWVLKLHFSKSAMRTKWVRSFMLGLGGTQASE